MSLDLIVAVAIFIASVAVAIGLSLFVLTVVLRMQHKHRKRLARVGRRRMSGRLDLDDARLMLVRQKQESNLVVKLTEALARFIPLLDTDRLRANFRRAGARLVGRRPSSPISLAVGAVIAVLGDARARAADLRLPACPGSSRACSLVDRFVKFRGGGGRTAS